MLGCDEARGVVGVDLEVVVSVAFDDRGAGDAGDVAVERVGGLEQQGAAARPAEGEQQRLQDLVGAVGTEDLVGGDVVEVGDGLAQLGGGAVGVAVERDLLERCQELPAPGVGGAKGDSLVLRRTSASTWGE